VSSKIREKNLIMILKKLMDQIVKGSPETTDIFALTVRGIVQECQDQTAPSIITTIYQGLIEGISSQHENVTWECLEICTEVFKKYGLLIQRQQNLVDKDRLMASINTQLSAGRSSKISKSASLAMGAFAIILNPTQLNKLVSLLLTKIHNSKTKQDKTTQVQCLTLMAKSIGNKLSPHVPDILSVLIRLMMLLDEEQSHDDANDLSEACLTTIASIIRRCTVEIDNYMKPLIG